jgi:hypothetical protein
MRHNFNKEFLIGLLIGLFSPIVFVPIMLSLMSISNVDDFNELWNQFLANDKNTSRYLSLALISNLIWFYFFLNKEKYYYARGIIMGMMCFAPYMIYIYFIR